MAYLDRIFEHAAEAVSIPNPLTFTGAQTYSADQTISSGYDITVTKGLLNVGVFSSATAGSGAALSRSGTNTAIFRVYADDAGAALTGTGSVPDIRGGLSRVLLTVNNTGGHIRVHGLMGQLKAYDAYWNTEVVSALHGRLELVRSSATMTLGAYGVSASVLGVVGTSGTITVNTNHVLAGVAAISDFKATLTQTGKVAAFYAAAYDTTNWSDATSRTTWGYGLLIDQNSAARGVHVGALGSNTTSGMPIGGATCLNGFYADDSGAAQTASTVWRNLEARTYFSIDQGNAAADFYSIRGQIKAASGIDFSGDTSVKACIQGYLECAGATICGSGAFLSSVMGEIWTDGDLTGTGHAGALMARIYTSTGTVSGIVAGVVVCKQWASTQKFTHGLYIQDGAVTVGNDIRLMCGATISGGAAEPTHTATQGSLYIRTGQAKNATFYQNTDGGTTWVVMDATTT